MPGEHHPRTAIDDERGPVLTGFATVGGPSYHDAMGGMFNVNPVINAVPYFVGAHTGVWIIKTTMEFPYPDPIPDALRTVIAESLTLLDLKDNWDREGSSGYSQSTWQRAVSFLVAQWSQFLKEMGHPMEIPSILPDANGSIDLWWDTKEFQLLISIPGSELLPASYYGHKHRKEKIEYAFDSSKPDRRLIRWMAKVEGAGSKKILSPK
jgi:hypothetical protein